MAVHHIKIKKEAFEPATITARQGDQIKFQLADRADPARVTISGGTLFEDGNAFEVSASGQEKTIPRGFSSSSQYRLSATMSTAVDSEVTVLEQTGTMNGSITVMP